jgi:hypothetical protein
MVVMALSANVRYLVEEFDKVTVEQVSVLCDVWVLRSEVLSSPLCSGEVLWLMRSKLIDCLDLEEILYGTSV